MDKWKKTWIFKMNDSIVIDFSLIHSFICYFIIWAYDVFCFFFCMTCLPIWYLKFVILECFVLFYFMMLTNNEWWRHNMEQQQQQHIINYVEQIEKNGKKMFQKSNQNKIICEIKNEMKWIYRMMKKMIGFVSLGMWLIDWLIVIMMKWLWLLCKCFICCCCCCVLVCFFVFFQKNNIHITIFFRCYKNF